MRSTTNNSANAEAGKTALHDMVPEEKVFFSQRNGYPLNPLQTKMKSSISGLDHYDRQPETHVRLGIIARHF